MRVRRFNCFSPVVMHAGAKNSRLRVLLRVAISNLINSKHTASKCNENRGPETNAGGNGIEIGFESAYMWYSICSTTFRFSART